MSERFTPDEVARFRIAVARITKGVDRTVRVEGLTRTKLSVLSSIARLGPLRAGELAEYEGLNPTMLSRVVGSLEDRGFVQRSPDPRDKRVTLLATTEAGQKLHERLRRERTALFTRHFKAVGRDQAATLVAALPALEALAASMAPVPAEISRPSNTTTKHPATA